MLTSIRLVVLPAVLLLLTFGGPRSAAGAPPVECEKKDPVTGVCLISLQAPPDGGGGDGAVDPVDIGGAAPAPDPNPCTYAIADPQPWSGDPVWSGHRPEEGTIWMFTCPRPAGFGSGLWTGMVFLTDGVAAPAGPVVDPAVLAQQAIGSMTLRAPEIKLAPPPESMSGLVGLPVWMWVEPGSDTTGPVRASASAGGVTVNAVAQVSQVLWDMGDGNTVTCGLGTPYAGGAETSSPDCGYVYAQASSRHVPDGGRWPITATSTWTVTWSGGGLSGSEALELSSSAELFVGELHVLNQDGSSR